MKITIKRSSVVLWSLIVVLLVMVVLSLTLRRQDTEMELPPERAVPVYTVTVAREDVVDRVELPGRIEADVRARLAVDKGGRVTELLVDRGDVVQAGQELLRLDDRLWRAHLERAEIEDGDAAREYARWEDMAKADAVSVSELDVVRARRERARVQLEEARIHVEQCVVRSPADGRINDRFIEVGEFAAEGVAVLELVVSDPAKLVLQVPERDIGAVEQGAELDFEVAVLGSAVWTGTVAHVAEAASPGHSSYRVELRVPNEERILRPGMIARARLERARRADAVVVPLAAVIPRAGEHVVFVVQDDRAVRRLVKIDRFLGDRAVLADGLEPGEELVVEGHRRLIDGSPVKRVPRAQDAEAADRRPAAGSAATPC